MVFLKHNVIVHLEAIVTPTLAQTTMFGLPANRQLRAQIDNAANTNPIKKSPDGVMIAVVAPATGMIPVAKTNANEWMAPPKKDRTALCIVITLHLALIWSIQSGFFGQIKKINPTKNVLMTYIAPSNFVPTPAQKSPPKTVAVTTPVLHTPTALPITQVTEPTIERAIESTSLGVQMSTPQINEVATPITPAAAVLPKTIVSGVEYIKAPQPDYPLMAKRAGEQGKVMLRILVNEKGLPESVELQKTSGSARLDEAAKQAAFRARFKPYMEDGKTVAVYVIVPITFQLSS